jgi:hypothetical protein
MDMGLTSAGDLYTHPEVDEEDDDSSSKASLDRPASAVDVKTKNRLSGSFAESGSTSSSLQEFERLENEILRSASHSGTPQKTPQKTAAGNHVLVVDGEQSDRPADSSPDEKVIMLSTQSTLSEIDEGHESQASDSGETVTGGSQESDTDSDAIDKQLTAMERITSKQFKDPAAVLSDQNPARRPDQIDLISETASKSSSARHHVGERNVPITPVQENDSHGEPTAAADEDDAPESGEQEDEFDEESCRTREESYRISHCMLASADSIDMDAMTCSFRSEATLISSSEGLEFSSEPRLAYAGSTSVHSTSNTCVEHVTTASDADAEVYSSSNSSSTKTTHSRTSVTHFEK